MKTTLSSSILFCLVFFISSCGDGNRTGAKDEEYLTNAIGKPWEVVIVMDSTQWEGEVGMAMRDIFEARTPGILKDEKMFKVLHVRPQGFSGVLKEYINVVTVTHFQGASRETARLHKYYTPESIKNTIADTSMFMFTRKNEYAKGQQVLHLFSGTEERLLQNIKANTERIQSFFNELAITRMTATLKPQKKGKAMMERLSEEIGLSLKLSEGFQWAMEHSTDSSKFIWIRHVEIKFDRSLVLASKPYLSSKQFEKDSIMAWRNAIGQSYIYGDPENTESYMTTETLVPPTYQEINHNGGYAVLMKGLWKTNNLSRGGSFVTLVWVDEEQQHMYYLEGFVYGPDTRKREHMRELEAIIRTSKVSS